MRRNHTWRLCIGLAVLPFLITGCKKGEFDTATVTGTVYCNGKPLEGGEVVFHPQSAQAGSQIVGKPASGVIKPDGTYELTTYGGKDGAVIGTCHVKVWAPTLSPEEMLVQGDEDVEETPPELACEMEESDVYPVVVEPGENVIDIKLPIEK